MAITKKAVSPSHGAWRLSLPCASSSPSEADPGGKPEAEKVERGQRGDRAVQDEGHEGERRHHGVGQQVLEDDAEVGQAERPGRRHIFEIAGAQEFRAHHADQSHPGKGEQDAEQDPEIGLDHRRDDDQQIELRHAGPDLDEALEQEIGPAAEIALHRAGGDPDQRGEEGEHQPEQHRDAETVDHAGDDVAALVVGAEPVPFELGVAGMKAALDRELAILVAEQPGRLHRKGHRRVLVLGVVGKADRRPQRPAARVRDHAP